MENTKDYHEISEKSYAILLIEPLGVCWPDGDPLDACYSCSSGNMTQDYNTIRYNYNLLRAKGILAKAFLVVGNDVYWLNSPDLAEQQEACNAFYQLRDKLANSRPSALY